MTDDDYFYEKFKITLKRRKNPFRLRGIKSPPPDMISGNICMSYDYSTESRTRKQND